MGQVHGGGCTEPVRERAGADSSTEDIPGNSPPPRPPPPPIPDEILRKIHEVEQETFLGQIPMQEPRGSPGKRRPEVLPENMFIRVLHGSLRRVAGAEERPIADGTALVRTVELTRAPGEMLGFYIRQGNGLDRDHGIFVSRIMAGSLVDRYGLLRIGDEILTVNSVDVSYMKLAEVVAIMQIPTRLVMNVTTQKYATLPVKGGVVKGDQLAVETKNPTRTPNKPRRSASQRISRSPKSSGRQKAKRPERSSSLEDKRRIPFQKDQISDDFDFEKFLFNPPSLKEKPLPEIPKDCMRPTKTPPAPPPSKDKEKIKEALCSGKRLTRLDLAVARTKLDEAYHQAYDLLLNSLEKEEEERAKQLANQNSHDADDGSKTPVTAEEEEEQMEEEEDGRGSPEGEACVSEVPLTWTKLDRSLRSHHLESLQHHSSRSSSDREEWGDDDIQGDSYVEHNPIYESDEDDYNSAPVWSEGQGHTPNGFIKKNGPVMDGGTDEDDPRIDPQDYSNEDRADYESGTWKSDKTWQSDSSCAPADMAESPMLQRRGRVGKIGEVHARAVLSPPRSPSNITVKKKQEWYQRRAKISPELARRISGENEEEGQEEENIGEPEEPDLSRSRSPKREGFWSALSQLSPTTGRKFGWKKPATNRSQSVEEENRQNIGTDSDDSPKMTQRNHALLPEIALTPEQKLSSLQNKGKVVAKYHLDSTSNSDSGGTTRGGGVGSVFTRTRLYRSFNRDRSNNDRTMEKIPNGDLAGRVVDLGSYKKCKSDDGNKGGLCPVSGVLAIELYSLKGMKVFKKSSKDLYCVIEVDGAPRARTVVRDGEQEVVWNEKFALELNDAYQICFNFYNWDNIRRHKVNCAGTLNLSHLTRQANEKIALKMDPRGTMYVTLTLDPNMEDGVHSLNPSPGLGRLFGMDLDRVVEEEGGGVHIPLVITKCVSEVEDRGLSVVGIYRLCGSAYRKKDLRDEFEIDSIRTDISADKYPDINVITGVLKDFLRELPEPLFSPALSDIVCAKPCDRDPEEMLQCLGAVQKLTLGYLLDHLKRVAANSSVNKMDYNNLAVCFGPVLCSPPQGSDVDGAQGALLAAIDFRKHIAALQTLLELWPADRDPKADKDQENANDDPEDKDEPNNNDLPESDSTLLYSRLRGNTSSSEDSRPEADRTDSDTSQRSHEPSPRLGRDGSPRTGRLQVYDEVFEETAANLPTRYQSYEEMEEFNAEGGKIEQSTLERRMVERGKMVQRDRSFRGDRPARVRVTVEEDYMDMEGGGVPEEKKSPKRSEGGKTEGKERDENIANESKDTVVGDRSIEDDAEELMAKPRSRISRKHEKEYVNLAPYRAALGVSSVDDEGDSKVATSPKLRQQETPKSPAKAYIDYAQLSKSRERLSDSSSSREQLTDSSERLTESPKPYHHREQPSPRDGGGQASGSEKAYIDMSQLRGPRKLYLQRSRTEEIHARYPGAESASEEHTPTIQVSSSESIVRRRLRSFEGDSRGEQQGPAPFARAGIQGEGAEQSSCRQRGRARAATDSALFIHEGDSDFEEDRLLARDFARHAERLSLQTPVPESLSVDEGIDVRALSPQDLSVDVDLSTKFHDIDRLVSETIKDTLLASTSPYKGGAKASRSKDSLDSGAVLSPSMSRDVMAMGGSQPSPEGYGSRDEGWSDIDQWILERWNSIDHLMETWTLTDNPSADVSEC
ncbi:rho GTPase-activating protein syd-1-like isoform X1 [Branchiostoma lanceolatum]|uniref:rho GTPase-activating protein syd-1-like isoform X1 n=2 Tax=Branchiostoma lanceolatum TaxID=7740 RepID=UPI003454D181